VQMKTRVAGVLATTACAVGMLGVPAFASTYNNVHVFNYKNTTILSDNTVNIPISIPVDVCGNAIAILGFAEASCQGGAGVFLNSPNGGW
jgi:ChpA-C